MSAVWGPLAYILSLGLLGAVVLFILGIAADELVRNALHRVFGRRFLYVGHVIWLSLFARSIPVSLVRTFHVKLDNPDETDVGSKSRETFSSVASGLSGKFDDVESKGESIIEARSPRDSSTNLRMDLSWSPVAGGIDLDIQVVISGKVPYWHMDRHIMGLKNEFDWVQAGLSDVGPAPSYDPTHTALEVELRKPVDVVETLKRFEITSFQGRSAGFQIELDQKSVTFRGDFGAELAKAAGEVVTWYY